MTGDIPTCACFNISERQIRDYFAAPGATFDGLVEQTLIGTKCTACLFDLDLVLEGIHRSRPTGPGRAAKAGRAGTHGLRQPVDQANSGFLICENNIRTILRIANHGQLFDRASPMVPYDYRLFVFSEDGRLCARHRGEVAPDAHLELDLTALPGAPDRGWFLVALYPHAEGLLGSVRPYVALRGDGWATSYHLQPQSMATRARVRNATFVKTIAGKTLTSISVINASARPTEVRVEIGDFQGGFGETRSFSLPARGSSIVDLDALFDGLPDDALLMLRIFSDQNTRKHILNVMDDGAWGVDHFPNLLN